MSHRPTVMTLEQARAILAAELALPGLWRIDAPQCQALEVVLAHLELAWPRPDQPGQPYPVPQFEPRDLAARCLIEDGLQTRPHLENSVRRLRMTLYAYFWSLVTAEGRRVVLMDPPRTGAARSLLISPTPYSEDVSP